MTPHVFEERAHLPSFVLSFNIGTLLPLKAETNNISPLQPCLLPVSHPRTHTARADENRTSIGMCLTSSPPLRSSCTPYDEKPRFELDVEPTIYQQRATPPMRPSSVMPGRRRVVDKEAEPQGTYLIVSQPSNDTDVLFPLLGRRSGISIDEDSDHQCELGVLV